MSSQASPLQSVTDETINHLGSKWCHKDVDCAALLRYFCRFKPIADAVEKASRTATAPAIDFVVDGQALTLEKFKQLNEEMGATWKAFVDANLDCKAHSQGLAKGSDLTSEFVQHHMTAIEGLGYVLASEDKEILTKALTRFFVCDIGPAPFSLIQVATRAVDSNNENDVITCSGHMRAMATHWLRHPPECFSLRELEELVVLSLFHDIYYFDDFVHHDTRVLDDFGAYLVSEVGRNSRPAQLINSHLKLAEDLEKVATLQFGGSNPGDRCEFAQMDALQQEWIQIDWYLSTTAGDKFGQQLHHGRSEGVVALPLAFFHHHIGRFFTKHRSEGGRHFLIERTAKHAMGDA